MKQLELEKVRLEDKVMRMQSMVMHEQTARVGNDDNIIVPYVLLQECMMTMCYCSRGGRACNCQNFKTRRIPQVLTSLIFHI